MTEEKKPLKENVNSHERRTLLKPKEAEEEATAAAPSQRDRGPPPPPAAAVPLGYPASMDKRYFLVLVPLLLSSCVYLAVYTVNSGRVSPTLVKAFVGFRHGSRAPLWSSPSDPYGTYNSQLWPEGPDQLTKKGKMEAYKLGERLRQRYHDFLGSFYLSKEVRAYSTLVERTLMSGQLVLTSLYPPVGYQLWNEGLAWQPIPLYPEYIFNKTVGSGCPKFRLEAMQNVKKSFKALNENSREVMSHIAKKAGSPETRPQELFIKVWDATYFKDRAGIPIPDWVKEVYPDKMSHTALTFLVAFIAGSDIQKKLVLDNYAHAIKNFFSSEDQRKMEIHSWHDLNNIALLKALQADINIYPEPTSCVVVELHERRGEKFAELYYYDSSASEEPRQLKMPCGFSCPEAEFYNLLQEYRVDNYTELCGFHNSSGELLGLSKISQLAV